eukprot:5009185-Lingulodinium_polyedra.AAC.1
MRTLPWRGRWSTIGRPTSKSYAEPTRATCELPRGQGLRLANVPLQMRAQTTVWTGANEVGNNSEQRH